MSFETSYSARMKRLQNAVTMQPVDKIPLSINGNAYVVKESGYTPGECIRDPSKTADGILSFFHRHPAADCIHGSLINPYGLSALWLSPVKVPGIDLPDDELWQVLEKEIVTFDDYEAVLREGYGSWSEAVLRERLGDPLSKMNRFIAYRPISERRLVDAGIPNMNLCGGDNPFEHFCGGRTLMEFFMDIVEEPETIKAVLDKTMEHDLPRFQRLLEAKPSFCWIGGWRGAPELLSHDTWMEFVWPYLEKLILTAIDAGTTPVLHFDSCWDRELETLKSLPEQKCILMLDGSTDIRKARAVLDDRMCLMGDTPASMLAFSTPEEVYTYVSTLIDDIGPKTGYIVSSGCDIPYNAKPENVAAMIAAAEEYSV